MSVDLSYKTKPDNDQLDQFSGDTGMPLLGNAIPIVTDYLNEVQDRMQKYGNFNHMKMFSQHSLMVAGPDLYQTIFQDRDNNFSAEMGYIKQLGEFYLGGLLIMDFDEHKAQRRMMQSAFRTQALTRYLEMMQPYITKHVQSWGKEGSINFYDKIKPLLLEIGADCFLGLSNVGEEMKHVNDLFLTVNDGLVSMVTWNVPFTTYGKAKRARVELEAYFLKLIRDRRAQGAVGDDMLTQFAMAKDENGNPWSEQEVMKHGIFLLFAAHDTTSSVLTSLARILGGDPAAQQRCRDEANASGTESPTREGLDAMTYTGWCFSEALRLYPSVPMYMRRTIREFEWEGKTIPANTVLAMPTIINHLDPKYWTNPTKFDPERFSEERAEHRGHPMCYTPFGGGLHKCIGYHFAELMTKAVLREIVRNWEFTTPAGYNPTMEWFPLPKAKDGVPLALKKPKAV